MSEQNADPLASAIDYADSYTQRVKLFYCNEGVGYLDAFESQFTCRHCRSVVKKTILLYFLVISPILVHAPSYGQSLVAPPASGQSLAAPPQTISGSSNSDAIQFYNAGIDAYLKHDLSTAQKDFKKAIDSDPNLAEAHCNYGYTLVLDGKYQDALPELIKARDLKPEIASTWSGLGACYQSLGKTADAITSYKKYIELAPPGEEPDRIKNLVTMLEGELARGAKSSARNGANDYIGDATQNGIVRWPTSRMPIKVYIKSGQGVPGYRPSFDAILRKSLQDWLDAAQGKIRIQIVENPDLAQMVVSWTNNPNEMISSAEGGHAMVSPDDKGILKAHIYLLTIKPEDGTILTDNQARRVDLHEIGHALGIFGHSHNPGDIMFGSMPPGDLDCSLSEKDKNTISALYSLDANTVARNPLSHTDELIAGDPNSAVVKAAKLNHEAVDALRNKNFVIAVQKLEQAQKLDPTNELFAENLGIAYGNCALAMMMLGNVQQANDYFNRAIPLAEKGSNKQNLIAVLKNYWMFCKASKREAEAKKTETRLKELGAIN
jgi:tetratricopeptide (TPR) repeat protein